MLSLFLIIGLFLPSVSAVAYLVSSRRRRIPNGCSALPGPKGWPLVGSALELQPDNPWMSFQKWAHQYGPIYNVNLGGHNHIWISDEKIAQDLLNKRAAIYSDRPHIPGLIDDNRDSGKYLPLMTKNVLWHRQRRFAATIMRNSQQAFFHGYPELEAKRMMKELLDKPSEYNTSFESYIARIICRLAWGTAEASDELKQRARELLVSVSPTGALGNKLPFVMSLPDFLSPAKAWERRRAATEHVFFSNMQNHVKSDIQVQKAGPSWTKSFLNGKSHWGFRDDTEGAFAVGMHGIAGALTVAAPIQGFCLAMCLYPHVLKKLHHEVDRVCGDRPPTYADMPLMPYLRACIRETLRWRPPVPTGIPHEVSCDDIYEGYFIPAKSIVHPFEWGMSRDPSIYPKPNAFDPDRWIDPSFPTYREPLTKYPTICQYSQFGFGRRVCQGMEVAESELFVGIGSLVWGFDIRKAINPETGIEIPVPEMDYTPLLIAKPHWFHFSLTPRNEQRQQRIEELFQQEAANEAYPPSRVYWDEKTPGLGWGKI